MKSLTLILVDPKPALIDSFRKYFDGLPNVQFVTGYFQDLPAFDCMVSAANSFGLMDGGVDAAITQYFGQSLMERVQQRIIGDYYGEQPVGTSLIVETGTPKHPYVAHTPTMRIPMNISRTDNVYRAMWAMLIAVGQHNKAGQGQPIEIVACPGLGTATGRVPYAEAAKQMALAYRNFLNPPYSIDWRFAGRRQEEIRYGGDIGDKHEDEGGEKNGTGR